MKKEQDYSGENKPLKEPEIPYLTKLDRSIQQAKEGKTIKVKTDEELKNLLNSL